MVAPDEQGLRHQPSGYYSRCVCVAGVISRESEIRGQCYPSGGKHREGERDCIQGAQRC